MSELVIQPFTIQPLVGVRDGAAILRWAYNRPFLDSDNVQVQWGTQSTGFAITVPCSIASGLVSVDLDSTLWTTDNAQDISPLTILISAWLLTSQGKLIQQLQIAGKTQWVVPSSQIPTTTWNEFSNYNQAVSLYYYNPNFYNAPQVDAQIRAFAETNYASETHLGGVFTSIAPALPTEPVAWITDDPLVRDAIKIQGVDVTAIAPTDGMAPIFSQALNAYTPTLVGPSSGNVTSNEVSSVDGQVTLASGTGGHTIKFSTIIDDGTSFDATGMRVIASEYDSDSASIADNGTIRLNKDDFIAWRNEADGGNIILDKNASDQIASTGGFAGNLTGDVTGNVSGTASNLSGTPALPNGTSATTQSANDNTTKLATTAYADAAASGVAGINQLTSDVTAGPGTGSQAATIANDAVTYAKMQPVSAGSRLLGRGDSGTGDVEEILLGTNLSITGTTLNAAGGGGGGTVTNTGTMTDHALILGNTGVDVTALGSLGTTVTVLHGNVAGDPSFGVVVPGDAAGHTSGSGDFALTTGPTFSAPVLGTPASGDLSNCTALPVGSITGLGTGVGTFLATPSSANLAGALTDETGSGVAVFGTSPTITTPVITSPQISLTAAHGSDDTYTGTTIVGLNAGASISQWDLVYLGSSSTWLLADANGSSTYPARGVAVAAYSNTNPATILIQGTVRNDAWNWTPGGTLYLDTTAGGLTQTPPSASGDKVQQVGFALTADIAFFDMNTTWLTVT